MSLFDLGGVEKLLSRFDLLEFDPEQCSRERNRLSSCQECVRVCPNYALSFSPDLQVNLSMCDGCGVCVTVCPNGVFELKNDPDNVVLSRATKLATEAGVVSYACGVIYRPRKTAVVDPASLGEETEDDGLGEAEEADMQADQADETEQAAAEGEPTREDQPEEEPLPEPPPGAQVLSSLGRLTEALLVGAVAQGNHLVWLESAHCADCDRDTCREVVEQTLANTERLLKIFGTGGEVVYTPEFPGDRHKGGRQTIEEAGERAADVSRRQFFSSFRRSALAAGAMLVEDGLTQITGKEEQNGAFTYRVPTKRAMLLKVVRKLGQPQTETVESDALPFTDVRLLENCNLCNNCARFCPTTALREHQQDGRAGLVFSVANCTDCRLCLEICPIDAIELIPQFAAGALLTDQPRFLKSAEMEKCRACLIEVPSVNGDGLCAYCAKRKEKLNDDSWF